MSKQKKRSKRREEKRERNRVRRERRKRQKRRELDEAARDAAWADQPVFTPIDETITPEAGPRPDRYFQSTPPESPQQQPRTTRSLQEETMEQLAIYGNATIKMEDIADIIQEPADTGARLMADHISTSEQLPDGSWVTKRSITFQRGSFYPPGQGQLNGLTAFWTPIPLKLAGEPTWCQLKIPNSSTRAIWFLNQRRNILLKPHQYGSEVVVLYSYEEGPVVIPCRVFTADIPFHLLGRFATMSDEYAHLSDIPALFEPYLALFRALERPGSLERDQLITYSEAHNWSVDRDNPSTSWRLANDWAMNLIRSNERES